MLKFYNILFSIIVLLCISNLCFGQANYGRIEGTAYSLISLPPGPASFVQVRIFKGGILKGEAKTDKNGSYKIVGIEAGVYLLEGSRSGLGKLTITDIRIIGSDEITLDLYLPHPHLKNVPIKYENPVIINTKNPNRQTISREQLRRMNR